jgi:hypothetical protein
MVRNSLCYVCWKHRKGTAHDLRTIHSEPGLEAADQALEAFSQTWDEVTPLISRHWRTHWAQLRKVTKKRGVFPTETCVRKVPRSSLDGCRSRAHGHFHGIPHTPGRSGPLIPRPGTHPAPRVSHPAHPDSPRRDRRTHHTNLQTLCAPRASA